MEDIHPPAQKQRIHPIIELVLRCVMLDIATIGCIAQTCLACSVRCREDETWRRRYDALLSLFPGLHGVFQSKLHLQWSLREIIQKRVMPFAYRSSFMSVLWKPHYDFCASKRNRSLQLNISAVVKGRCVMGECFRAFLLGFTMSRFRNCNSICCIPYFGHRTMNNGTMFSITYLFMIISENRHETFAFEPPIYRTSTAIRIREVANEKKKTTFMSVVEVFIRFQDFPHHLLKK